jgi:NCAIR mutase (PurE)-related protein
MDRERLQNLLMDLQKGRLSVEEVMNQMKMLPFEAIDEYTRIDHQRSLQTGFPEVIFAEGKTPEKLVKIFHSLQEQSDQVLATRVSEETYALVQDRLPEAIYHAHAR